MKIEKVCETCGSEDVFIDAYADWDVDSQSWELSATYDLSWVWQGYCAKCDREISIINQEYKEDDA